MHKLRVRPYDIRPVYLMLPFVSGWRKERRCDPWHLEKHLFRQPAPGDWQSALRCVNLCMQF